MLITYSVNWKEFINWLLDTELRLSTVDVENLTGIKNPIIYRWKEGTVGKPQRSTIRRLEEGLKIKINDSDPENITYVKLQDQPKQVFTDAIPVNEYPLLGTVYAGEPEMLNHVAHGETIPIPRLRNNDRCFALRVNGRSMETTLADGDIVLVNMDITPHNGDLVAVKLKNGNQYIKRFKDLNFAFIQLSSDNTEYGARLIDKNDIEAIYPVVYILMKPPNGERQRQISRN